MDANAGGDAQPYAALVPADHDNHNSSDDDDGDGPKSEGKSRRELPSGAVATLKSWLLSPEHFTHPYPTPQDQVMLMQKTGIDKKQLKNWFTNARRRIWKPMLKKQLEAGKLAAVAAGGTLSVNVSGGGGMTSGLGVPQPDMSVSQHPYQQQQQQQQQQSQAPREEMYSNFQQAQMQQGNASQLEEDQQYQQSQYQQQQYHQQQQGQYDQGTGQMQQQVRGMHHARH